MRQDTITSKRVRRWATLQQAAEYVCCHPKTISRRFHDGTLHRYRMGRRILVDLDELDAVMESTAFHVSTRAAASPFRSRGA
ncbi:MAG: excisionase family DNA-binding protein [Arachnia sp.]